MVRRRASSTRRVHGGVRWGGQTPGQGERGVQSSGGKETLLGISKRGDRYLRSLLVHGARSVVRHAVNKEDRLSRWINRLKATRGANKAAVALANKMARIGWAILSRNSVYQAPPAHAAAG